MTFPGSSDNQITGCLKVAQGIVNWDTSLTKYDNEVSGTTKINRRFAWVTVCIGGILVSQNSSN